MRWGLYGLFVGTLPPAVLSFVAIADPSWRGLYENSLASQALIPLFFFVALARYDLFDVDRLISMTALWSVVGIVVLAAVRKILSELKELIIAPDTP